MSMFWDKKEDKNKLPDLPLPKTNLPFGRPIFEPKSSLPTEDLDAPELPKPIDLPETEEDSSDSEDLSASDIERHSLPSFPDSPIKKGFSQSAIKEAVNPEHMGPEEKEEFPLPELPHYEDRRFKTTELEEDHKPLPTITKEIPNKEFRPMKLGLPPVRPQVPEFVPKPTEKADIFIRIDKFKAARRSLSEIKLKVDDVESLLRKIRETKLREEQELSGWESDLNAIKAKIKDVTQNIFEKTE